MFISVIIPLFNKQDYIIRSINSVLMQTHSDFELIVVNDGSTDNSRQIVESINDPRLNLITQSNGGVSKARNTGVKAARARWVAFLDADDEYMPDFLEEISNFIENNNNRTISFVGANYYIGNVSNIACSDDITTGLYDYFDLFRNQKSPNNSSTTCVNVEFFNEVGGFPVGIKQFEDWITYFKLGIVGSFGFINKPLALYHYIENSASNAQRDLHSFFNDAGALPETALEMIELYSLDKERSKKIKLCTSEFALNISTYLARRGRKLLALKMLLYIKDTSIFKLNLKKSFKLIVLLIIPDFIMSYLIHIKVYCGQ